MSRFCLICIFLCAVSSIGKAQTTDSERDGDSLFAARRYDLAAVYYEKALFEFYQGNNAGGAEQTNGLLFKKTQCQKNTRSFEEAWQTVQRFELHNAADTIQHQLRSEWALCAYLSKHYSEAYGQLQQTRFAIQDTALTNQLDVLEILTLNELERWPESKQLFTRYAARNGWTLNVDALYAFSTKKKRSPERAQLLSFLMPGLGQVYAGFPGQGVASASLQGLSLAFGIYHVLNRYYLIGFFTGAGLFQSLYFGGARRAAIMAEDTNRKRKADNNEHIKAQLVEFAQKKGH